MKFRTNYFVLIEGDGMMNSGAPHLIQDARAQ